jgi:hypothetical protein
MEFIIFAIGLGAGAAILGYLSWANICQGRRLARPLKLDQLKDRIDDVVVVNGSPEPREEIFTRRLRSKRQQILWQKIEQQERVSSGRSSYWRTVRTKIKKTDFWLHFPDGGKVYVYCEPTEVQGAGSATSGGGYVRGSTRAVQRWLPMVKRLTVMGRLVLEDEGAAIESDPKEGLFFSPSSPKEASRKELLKGYLQAAGALACAAGFTGLVVYFLSSGFKL